MAGKDKNYMMYNLYIGSNNKTKRLEIAKITKITGAMFQGFTVSRAVGFWQGAKENSAIVAIESASPAKIMQLAAILKKELKQDAIAIQKTPALKFV